MSQAQPDDATSGTNGEHQAAFLQVRSQLTDLDAAIVELRQEADRLLESAAARTVLTVVHSGAAPEPGQDEADPAADVAHEQAASAPGAPVWPQLDSYEPQHGSVQHDDGSFGAFSEVADRDATVLEFARPSRPVQNKALEDRALEDRALEDPTEQATSEHDPESSPSGMPADWNSASEDDAAIEKFFSAEVEPEPAQRWLLNE